MRLAAVRVLTVVGIAAGLLVGGAPAASAHPLGNFTVNTADRLVVELDEHRGTARHLLGRGASAGDHRAPLGQRFSDR